MGILWTALPKQLVWMPEHGVLITFLDVSVSHQSNAAWKTAVIILNLVDECRLDLPDPENGIVTCSQAKEYKSVCRFYCDQGYSLGLDPIYNQVKIHYFIMLLQIWVPIPILVYFNWWFRFSAIYKVANWNGLLCMRTFRWKIRLLQLLINCQAAHVRTSNSIQP